MNAFNAASNATSDKIPHWWLVTLAAAAVLMITMGVRQSFGLFVAPINGATGLSIATISFAMAVAQFVWGAIQPIAGALADRYGPARILWLGILVLAVGCATTPYMTGGFGLSFSIGLLVAAGSGVGSFSLLIGVTINRVPLHHRGTAAGMINAGGSFGQFVFAPIVQALITVAGWAGALWSLAFASLAALPLIRILCPRAPASTEERDKNAAGPQAAGGLKRALREALADRSYLLLHAGFFTCGFHIAFLVTHLPGEVNLCGLPASVASWALGLIGLSNIVGSLVAGWCVGRYRSKYILFWMYASRAVLVLIYLAAPKTEWTFYLFAIGLGFTWLATVPPTSGIVGKLFGTRYLATLFGLTLLSHQIGGFFGAWLGGFAITRFGDYTWMWYADAVLAAMAALVNLPIREMPVQRPRASASEARAARS